ncbi:uncharacterized protein BDR25DRAFT_339939 [Lindgomyces ingoldianus]|uniref:Uncharacterized protein n=1 Tax=Lindgomyces ingoldianus TaxID=673940 RepID=A0ACB6RBI9_9PLEO|nr:uncharacterized protein BDR25DRAFT_339939 [Lindgomyces ingoldianus]KAF2476080.1 hypothetical protein BDR25DRAFT_339939 [Lindgomyces ingoldianus]
MLGFAETVHTQEAMPIRQAMQLYSVLQMPPSVRERATRAASLMETLPYLTSIKTVSTGALELFRYDWAEEFTELADEITRSMKHDIQHRAKLVAGLEFTKAASDAVRLAIVILTKGKLQIRNQIVILVPFLLSRDAFGKALPYVPEEVKRIYQSLQAFHGVNAAFHLSHKGEHLCTLELQLDFVTLAFGNFDLESSTATPVLLWVHPASPAEGEAEDCTKSRGHSR